MDGIRLMKCPGCGATLRIIEMDDGDELLTKDLYTCDTLDGSCDIVYVHILRNR